MCGLWPQAGFSGGLFRRRPTRFRGPCQAARCQGAGWAASSSAGRPGWAEGDRRPFCGIGDRPPRSVACHPSARWPGEPE
eukprot:584674-Pyramimonas_sp.AAC.1